MRRFFPLVFLLLFFVFGCTGVDSSLQDDIYDLKRRVAALEDLCKSMNTNIASIQSIATASQTGNYVTAVAPVTYNGKELGYTISFSSGESITIYHGNDGNDGHTPIIGVKADTEGVYYWTLDNDWLFDSAGQKVKAVGNDEIIPQLRIEDDYWYISVDNSKTWTKLCKVIRENGIVGGMLFQSVQEDDNYVYFTLAGGTIITVLKSSLLEVSFDPAESISLKPDIKTDITYKIISSITPVRVEVITSSNIRAKVIPLDSEGLAGTIRIVASGVIDEYSQIIVFINNGNKVFTESFSTYNGGLQMSETGTINDHEWVNLGLPSGLKWATCNVGANASEEFGDYFAWGETTPKSYYDFSTYKFRTSGDSYSWDNLVLSKYITSSSFGPVDNKSTLELEDDAATVNWGGSWRMPTDTDWTELIENCIWTWATYKGVAGWSVTSSVNGGSIFLPAAGYCYYDHISAEYGYEYCYWSSSLSSDLDYCDCQAWCIFGYRNVLERRGFERSGGLSVRAVTE